MKRLIVIPARWGSERLRGKPLREALGRPLIRYVYENALRCRAAEKVVVATDDERVAEAVRSFGGEAVMTSAEHRTGTDRVAEAAAALGAEYVVNVQGDEPAVPPGLLEEMFERLESGRWEVVTAARVLRDAAEMENPARVKMVCASDGTALLFTRAPVPHAREAEDREAALALARVHVGVYGFRREALLAFPRLPSPPLETVERLEQLRLLYHGYKIAVLECADFGDSIDTPEDLARFEMELTRKASIGGKD